MKKRFGLCLIGLWLMAVNGFSQDFGELSRAAPAEPWPQLLGPEGVPFLDFRSMSPNELMTRAGTMLQQGDTNTAINMLMTCHEMILWQNASGFTTLLNTMLATGNLPAAERIYRDNMAQRDNLTRDYCNLFHQYYVSQSNEPAMLEWTARLQAMALPPDLRVQAFGWLFEVSRKLGPVSRVTDLVPVCITNFDVPTSRNMLVSVITAYDSAGDEASANKVLDAIERTVGHQSELRLLATCQRVNLLFSAARWKEAEARFQKEAKALPDEELEKCFQYARACAIRNNQFDLSDRLCVWILKKQKNKPNTWQAAASAWLESAKSRKAAADVLVRLEALMQMGCPQKILVSSYYYDYWEMVVKAGKPADLIAMLKFSERLSAAVTDKEEKKLLKTCVVDGYFVMEDYEQALKLIEEPDASMDPAEQKIAVNKIKAHLALQKGNKQEAVERFRDFMETVKTNTQPKMDPISGLIFTKEMCLALNAKRIGDILSSMNDAQGSQAAYQEAAGYYAVVQKDVQLNSPDDEYIKARQTELTKLLQK